MPISQVSAAHSSPDAEIHIFNGFLNPYGGSELEALSLYDLLRTKANVHLWTSSSRASKTLMQQYPIRRIAPHKGICPRGGTYIFVGAHWRNKLWPYLIPKPDRLIYIFNTFHPKVISITTNMPRLLGWVDCEFVLISDFQKTLLDIEGEVHPSPIDIRRFIPRPHGPGAQTVIGRLSRDTPDKHNPNDIPLYASLAEQGCEIRIQGGTSLSNVLPASNNIHLFPEGQMPAPDFLQGLDIFYYRTGTHVETFGRVVFEAMACGLPVVCHAHGGYAEAICHGSNGFLFDSTEEAQAIIAQLIANPALRATTGASARKTVESIYSEQASDERLAFYLK